MTSVDGVSLLRKRLHYLCLDGNNGYSASMLAALKTHVSLDEALLIEAVKCESGDSRHDFQEWYSKTYIVQRKAANQATIGTLDAAAVGEELKMTMQAIDEHERLLIDHRKAVLAGTATGGTDVDALHATLASLRANLPVLQAEHARLIGANDNG